MNQTVRVVIADDAEQLRALLARALSKGGDIEVVGQVGDGVSAVQAVADLDPDVLLLDLSMPVLDGLEVLRSVREQHERTVVLVFSGYGSGQLADTCRRLGAAGYVEKGTALPELRKLILDVAGSRSLW